MDVAKLRELRITTCCDQNHPAMVMMITLTSNKEHIYIKREREKNTLSLALFCLMKPK